MKAQRVVLWVTIPDDASDPDILVPEVLEALFDKSGDEYNVKLVESDEVQNA